MMPMNPNPNQGAFGFMRIVLTLGVIICIAFPAVALGQSAGEDYVGQKTQIQCAPGETPSPLSCPYPPSPYPIRNQGMIVDELPHYQANFKENPDEYYQSGKLPGKPTVQKGE